MLTMLAFTPFRGYNNCISNWILFLQSYSIILVSHMPLYPPQEWGVGTGMPKRVRVCGIIYTTSN